MYNHCRPVFCQLAGGGGGVDPPNFCMIVVIIEERFWSCSYWAFLNISSILPPLCSIRKFILPSNLAILSSLLISWTSIAALTLISNFGSCFGRVSNVDPLNNTLAKNSGFTVGMSSEEVPTWAGAKLIGRCGLKCSNILSCANKWFLWYRRQVDWCESLFLSSYLYKSPSFLRRGWYLW